MANPQQQQLAAALAAPPATAPRFAERSKYLARALDEMGKGGQNIQSGGELGLRLLAQALGQYGKNKADDRMYAAQAADRQAQQDALRSQGAQIFGDQNPQALAAFMSDPQSALAAYWKGQEPQTLSGGQTLLRGGQPVYTAPVMGMDGGTPYTQTLDSINWGQMRGPSNAEQETNRHNLIGEAQGSRGLDIQQQNANTGAFTAQTGRMAHDARVAAGGYGTPGVGGVIGATLPGDPNDWQIVPGSGVSNAPRR